MSTTPTSTTNDAPEAPTKPPDRPPLQFKRLTAECGRGAFVCGNQDIDAWFRKDAWDHHCQLRARVVTGHLPGNSTPIGFYAMTMRLEKEDQLDRQSRASSRSQSGYFMSAQLCSVAVHRGVQRQGLGTILMGAALVDFYEVAVRTGIYALTLIAVDQEIAKFYKKLGFGFYGDMNAIMPKMILPAASVMEMIEGRPPAPNNPPLGYRTR